MQGFIDSGAQKISKMAKDETAAFTKALIILPRHSKNLYYCQYGTIQI